MQSILVKSDVFEISYPFYVFFLNPDYVAARSLRSLRSNNKHSYWPILIFGQNLSLILWKYEQFLVSVTITWSHMFLFQSLIFGAV